MRFLRSFASVALLFAVAFGFAAFGAASCGKVKAGEPVPSIAFTHEGGIAKFRSFTVERFGPVTVGSAVRAKQPITCYNTADKVVLLNGKPATGAQLESFASTTVDIEVTVTDDAINFHGGKPAYGSPIYAGPIYAPQQSSCPTCPNGRCPLPR